MQADQDWSHAAEFTADPSSVGRARSWVGQHPRWTRHYV